MLSLSIMGAENQDLQITMLAVQLSADEKAWIMIPALMTLYRTHVTLKMNVVGISTLSSISHSWEQLDTLRYLIIYPSNSNGIRP